MSEEVTPTEVPVEETAIPVVEEDTGLSFADEANKAAVIEAIIFAHGEPIALDRLCEVLGAEEDLVKTEIEQLLAKYRDGDYGIELMTVAGKYQFRTKGVHASYLRALKEQKPRRLSPAALETLSVIAYRQPVTRHEVEKIRGVDPTPTLKTLLDKDLVTVVGHKDAVGQPGLYGTTEKFLHLFGLNSLGELPTLREFKAVESDPGEAAAEGAVEDDLEYIEEEAQAAPAAEL